MGKGRNRFRGSSARPNNNSNPPSNNGSLSGKVDLSIRQCKPTTKGAENIIFSAAGGVGNNEGHRFVDKRKKLAETVSQLPAFSKGGAQIAKALETLVEPTFEEPPEWGSLDEDKRKFLKDNLFKSEVHYNNNKQSLYYLLKNHCTEMFQGQLKRNNEDEFKQIEATMNGIKLAQLMEKVYLSDGKKQGTKSDLQMAARTDVAMYSKIQGKLQTNEQFVESLKARKDLSESFGHSVGRFDNNIKEIVIRKGKEALIDPDVTENYLQGTDPTDGNAKTKLDSFFADAIEQVQEQYFVFVGFELVDKSRFHGLMKQMESNDLTSQTTWPTSYVELIALLNDWERLHPRKQQQQQQQQPGATTAAAAAAAAAASGGGTTQTKLEGDGGDEEKGPSFMQQQGKKFNSKGESKCHICGAEDHLKNECPRNTSNDDEGVSGMQQHVADSDSDGELWVEEGANFGQTMESEQNVEEAKVYFDSCTAQSTVDAAELTDVHNPDRILKVLCNAGQMEMNQVGKLGDLDAWGRGDGQGIANLISIPKLEIYLQQQGGELKYSSNGEWILTLRGRTAVLRRDATGPCAGMPYMYLAEARAFFAPSDPQLEAVDIPHASDEQGWKLVLPPKKSRSGKQPRSILKPSKKSILKPPKKHQKQKPSAVVSAEANDDATTHPALVVSWVRPKVTGKVKARIVTRGDLHMQQSIRGNMEGFSKRQILRAHEARLLQGCIANLSEREFNDLVRNNQLKNCSISVDDISNASSIYGKARPNLRGSTTRTKPTRVTPTVVSVPRDFYKLHRFVTLSADVMFVNGLPFLTTVSENIEFLTAEFLPNRKATTLCSTLKKVMTLYGRNGFVVRVVHMDNEFGPLKEELPNVEIELTAKGEHVCPIERQHRTIKNRARGTIAELLYLYLPTQMVIHLIYHVVMCLNATNFKLLPTLSAREFVTGLGFDVSLHCQQPFGQYVEPHEDDEITNTMDSRTGPCICLGSTGNRRGTQKVLSLTSNQVIRRRNLRNQSLPVPDRIIRQVNALGIKNKKEEYGRSLEFLDRTKCPYSWTYEDEDELDQNPTLEYTSHPEMAAEVPGVSWADDLPELATPTDDDDSSVDSDDSYDGEELPDDYIEAGENTGVDQDESAGVDQDESAGVGPDESAGVDSDTFDVELPEVATPAIESSDTFDGYDERVDDTNVDFSPVTDVDDPDGPTGVEQHDDMTTPVPTYAEAVAGSPTRSNGPVVVQKSRLFSPGALGHVTGTSRYPRRERTQATKAYEPTMSGQSYPTTESAAMFFQQSTVRTPLSSEAESKEYMIGHIMMQQLFLQKGLKVFGKPGEAAVEKELQQMKDMDAYAPIDPSTLSEEEKKDAINQLMFLTQKRCGKIKARSCADGRKQRRYIKKEDASSPTAALEAIIITMCIEAKERRKKATIDIPGAFLHADNDEDVVMQLRGKLAELMVQIDPKLYRKYIVMENGKKVLYVKAQKACYGLLRSSLLFYLKLKGDLEGLGFEFNPYDPCTANKIIDGHQMTVVFHVDDLKVSHKDEKQIDWFADELRKIYGEKLTVNKGEVHDYLGMMIDYSLDGKVQISMIKFIKKIFELFPEVIASTAATPASDRLFHIRDEVEAKFLEEERADKFHSIVAMLLFLCMRARRDIQTAVSFLTTRVQKPDEDDWGKLKRVLKYLKGTLYMKLTLEVDNMSILKWWIDASHNVHVDCRGHTGTVFSLGKGAALSSSSKQKMNTRSSTESELVGAHDGLPLVLWCRHFIEAQGYTVDHNILYQDNQSTMLLQRNGRASSTKRTKHIHARYFFIKDKIEKDEIEVLYCPTKEMRADINTKPLQGSPFRVMRSHLMNVPEDYDDELERQRTSEFLGGPAKS